MYLECKALNIDAIQTDKQDFTVSKGYGGGGFGVENILYNTYMKNTKLEIIYGLPAM